jgi:general L-amino acid transport system substrate-binding protein
LAPDFAQRVIGAVGNYAEIYNRNLGPETSIGLERGLNSLYTEGGLLYGTPYR